MGKKSCRQLMRPKNVAWVACIDLPGQGMRDRKATHIDMRVQDTAMKVWEIEPRFMRASYAGEKRCAQSKFAGSPCGRSLRFSRVAGRPMSEPNTSTEPKAVVCRQIVRHRHWENVKIGRRSVSETPSKWHRHKNLENVTKSSRFSSKMLSPEFWS